MIERFSILGFSGGIVYDALIAMCAEKANAQKIITSNPSDFLRLVQAFQLDIEVIGI